MLGVSRFRVLKGLVRFSALVLLEFCFYSDKTKTSKYARLSVRRNLGWYGGVVLCGFAKIVLQVPVGSLYRSWPVKFLIQAAVALFRFASAVSRASSVQAANKQRQADAKQRRGCFRR